MDVRVICAETCTEQYSHTYVGQTEEQSSVPLSFLSAGTVDKVFVRNGQKVAKGAPLVSIDAGQTKNLLKGAEAKLHQAEDAYGRVMQVYQAGGVAEIKKIEVETQLSEAGQLVKGLRQQVADCVLRAPCAGTVSDVSVRSGQNVLPEVTVLKLVGMKGINVRFTVPEQDVVKIKEGDCGIVEVPALGERYECKVLERSLVPERLSHSYEVVCSVSAANDTEDILPGMVCKVRLDSDALTGIMVPAGSVQTSGNGLLLWVVENGRAERRSVSSSKFSRDGVLINDGIAAGDTVIVSGYQKLYDGMKVVCHEE